MRLGHFKTPPPAQARVLAGWYSAALNRWGVTLQRNGRWTEAAQCLTLAQDLNVDNVAARVNLECNTHWQAHQKMTVDRSQAFQEQFSKYRNLGQVITENGPFDEPSYCYQLGIGLTGVGMLRQACQQLDRIKTLVPDDLSVRLLLGDLVNSASLPDLTLRMVAEIKAEPALRPLGPTNEVEVAVLEARAWLAKTNRAMAQGILYALVATHPGDAYVAERAVATFTAFQSYSDALRVTDQQLQLNPNDAIALANKGIVSVLTGDFSNAIPLLTRSLSLTNLYMARLNRATAYLRTGRLDEAEADYQEILQAFPAVYRAYSGLGEIASQKRDTNAAIRYYEQYLAQARAADFEEA
ncbi:MAG TPA: tetratricopeptide repeat protein, partial [Candidatus Methylomirabilis sp.]|nr:tetratricopeptide repeat protein [Candidatus Methylomirabilis sp.]